MEHTDVLGEQSSVRLGKHLVHGLLRHVYDLLEELLRHKKTGRVIDVSSSYNHPHPYTSHSQDSCILCRRCVRPDLYAQCDGYISSCLSVNPTLIYSHLNVLVTSLFRTHTVSYFLCLLQ